MIASVKKKDCVIHFLNRNQFFLEKPLFLTTGRGVRFTPALLFQIIKRDDNMISQWLLTVLSVFNNLGTILGTTHIKNADIKRYRTLQDC